MLSIKEIYADIQHNLSDHRFQHTMNVVEAAKQLAKRFGEEEQKAEIAGLVHDVAKEMTDEAMRCFCQKKHIELCDVTQHNIQLVHGTVGALTSQQKYSINDSDILNAVRYHTTGRKGMSRLEKIIYISDMIEARRVYPEVEALRNMATEDLDKAVLMGLDVSIRHVMGRGSLIHLDTVMARNDIIQQLQSHEIMEDL
jgi:predicted HD superfamily hydrolase involved in NAD metabolism